MRLEDKNFEKEFMNWLNSKTTKELLDSLKRYTKKVFLKGRKNNRNVYSVKHEIKYNYSSIKYSKEFIEIVCKLPHNTVF